MNILRDLSIVGSLSLAMLGLGGCTKEEKTSVADDAKVIATATENTPSLSLVARLINAQEDSYDKVAHDFIEETKDTESQRLRLLQERNYKGRNALHVLMAQSSTKSLATAKMIFDIGKSLIYDKDSSGSTPFDSYASVKANLTHLAKLSSLKRDFSYDFCSPLKDQDSMLHKIARLENAKARNDALIYVLKNGGEPCLNKIGDNNQSPAALLVATSTDGQEIYALMKSEALALRPLDEARNAKLASQQQEKLQSKSGKKPEHQIPNSPLVQQPDQQLQQPTQPIGAPAQPMPVNPAPVTPIVAAPTLKQNQNPAPITPIVAAPTLKQSQNPVPITPIVPAPTLRQSQKPVPITPIVAVPTLKQSQNPAPITPIVAVPSLNQSKNSALHNSLPLNQSKKYRPKTAPDLSQSQKHVPTTPDFTFYDVEKYGETIEDKEVKALESFLGAVFAEIGNNSLTFPLSYGVGKHSITGVEHDIAREVRILSDKKVAVVLEQVIYYNDEARTEPKIIAAYDPINGEHLVRREAEAAEFELYQYLENNPLDGLTKVHSARKDGDKNEVFMKRYHDGNLEDVLSQIAEKKKPRGLNDLEKLSLIKKLIEGINNLHSIELELADGSGTKHKVRLSHRDLKGDNIFCEGFDDKKLSCVVGDFDTAVKIDGFSGTPGFYAPEAIALINDKTTPEDLLNFSLNNGQKADMWTLGEIMTSILNSQEGLVASFDAFWLNVEDPTQPRQTLIGQYPYEAQVFEALKVEWMTAKNSARYLETKFYWDLARQMLQEDPSLRPDAATVLRLLGHIGTNAKYVMGQYFNAPKQLAAKKLVGGIFHYCYIDMVDEVQCQGFTDEESLDKFPGLDTVAVVPPALMGAKVKDLIAGPFNTCAILQDDTLQCFGRQDPDNDLTALNGRKAKKVTLNEKAVFIVDDNDIILSSPIQKGLQGKNINGTLLGATFHKLFWSEENSLYEQDLTNTDVIPPTDLLNFTFLPSNIYSSNFDQRIADENPEAAKMLTNDYYVFGLTKEGNLFSSMPKSELNSRLSGGQNNKKKDIAGLDVEFNAFSDLYVAQTLDNDGWYFGGTPWFRLSEDHKLVKGHKRGNEQTLRAGTWIGGNPCDPITVVGDNDGVYDEIVIGQNYRCFKKSGGAYMCDR